MISIRNTQPNSRRAHLFLWHVIAAIILLLHRLAYIFLEVSSRTTGGVYDGVAMWWNWHYIIASGNTFTLIASSSNINSSGNIRRKFEKMLHKQCSNTVFLCVWLNCICFVCASWYVCFMYSVCTKVCVIGSVCSIYYEWVYKVTAREQMPYASIVTAKATRISTAKRSIKREQRRKCFAFGKGVFLLRR